MGRKKSQGGNRKASFSKCRPGTFKKANELCSLCAFETALVVLSPDGKSFPFDHPCYEAIRKKLANPGDPNREFAQHLAEHEATICELQKQYAVSLQELDAAQKRGEKLKRMREALGKTAINPLWERPIDELSLEELTTLKTLMEQVKGKLVQRLGKLTIQAPNAFASSSRSSAEAIDPNITIPNGVGAFSHGISHGY
ncbi:hypothetical protein MANES_12G119300v8 [Manihot esculenta]|uniref:MADS-box domain-containing protein n=1 Tax=Manihot esculenta TaxID=3983 RepID=A0A2C9UVG9_MANES|nr:hypothetical protein MANES_12G119300v8 [Manihot esculenta]